MLLMSISLLTLRTKIYFSEYHGNTYKFVVMNMKLLPQTTVM